MPSKASTGGIWSWVKAALASAIVVIIAGGLFFPALPHRGPRSWKSFALDDIRQLETAVKAYQQEYGRLPLGDTVHIEDDATQARLMNVLRAMDIQRNQRRVTFFYPPTATERDVRGFWSKSVFAAGLHPKSGVLLDPWGSPYRMRLSNGDKITSPYKDDEIIPRSVIVWSLGKDGVQGSPGSENIRKDSDDVVSW